MPLYTHLPTSIDAVDVIIAGGGTSGCVVASRLAEADPNLSILVVESGPDNYGNPMILHPALFITHWAPGSNTMKLFKGRKSEALANREPIVPVGRGLGGGSSVNLLMYSRAQRSDLDAWKMPGWSANELLPYMRKLETFHGEGAKALHGYDGPIHVSSGTYRSLRAENAFIEAATHVGWKEFEDLGNLDSVGGVQRALRYVSPDGKRQDTAHQYLHPMLRDGGYPNLHVVVDSDVDRVVFEGQRASGITYQEANGSSRTVKAKRMVIVSCGACGTPPVLERSGVGNPKILEKVGIKSISELPGVGDSYQDHQLISAIYKSNLSRDETLDGIVNGNFDIPAMIQNNDKLLGWNCMDVTCKFRPNDDEAATLGDDFLEVWNRDYKPHPDKPLSPGLSDALDFDPGIYGDAGDIDIKVSRWGYKNQREIARRMDIYRGEVPSCHPPFSTEDDMLIDKWLRENVATTWHPLGTCKMAPREENGVVDETLSVYGVTGLKIADLSIPPSNVGAHTNNTALTIGEKAASIFIRELGLAQ
ncbi:hypothetical protein DL764_003201 [Monosporascus ibericus]|uniref:Glucose-methanol-choline oxidoreductase N-terminal domain-containing protein n=1 Tax=Monosporascus ibericus TaxID=155417 RepID=A0A4Q4THF9_9PEZI|nr:hypothetical protein DL764_003201 [Monosporascus ibericus]